MKEETNQIGKQEKGNHSKKLNYKGNFCRGENQCKGEIEAKLLKKKKTYNGVKTIENERKEQSGENRKGVN